MDAFSDHFHGNSINDISRVFLGIPNSAGGLGGCDAPKSYEELVL